MKKHGFEEGDTVKYIGKQSSFLVGEIGTVTTPRTRNRVPGSVPVSWEVSGYYGCYPFNLELIARREPDWEV
jgi:alkyl sulfatase BDS1-like metallo-beta-lactamase superfamily hydrolase